MITKLLLTLLVVVGALLFARHRTASGQAPVGPKRHSSARRTRFVPAGLLLAVLFTAAFAVWLEWRDMHRIFTLRVIDTRSGVVRNYAVYRHDVQGRRFTTVDGREITLADVERMELMEGSPTAADR